MRADNWPTALREAIQRHQAGPYTVGSCDCASLVASVVEAVAGQPLLADMLTFTTHRGAARVLRGRGFKTALDVVRARFASAPVPTLRRGDLAWGPIIGDYALTVPAIVDGPVVVTVAHDGLIVFPRREMTLGWSVG